MHHRKYPIGAEIVTSGGVHFRVWAPAAARVSVVIEQGESYPLEPEAYGYHSGIVRSAKAGTRYGFKLDDDEKVYPDPASRFQPEGPHGPSEVVDPSQFTWSDQAWNGAPKGRPVIYEMHVGTFTPEGSYLAAEEHLPALAELGVTTLEIMPLADFPGRFGWGYDGVNMFAPTRLYGRPDELRQFINRAHELGLAVILDVVYNHFGPSGNYLMKFSPDYMSTEHKNEWGQVINFDGKNSAGVRMFFETNARYWIDEYHMDGYRFDATQAIIDSSPDHILASIARIARAAGNGRAIYLVGESEPEDMNIARPQDRGGMGFDAIWNDDFHHSALVAATGHHEAYYADFRGSPQELLSSAKYGTLTHGQIAAATQLSKWKKHPRGLSARDLPLTSCVNFLENHDQVANSAHGRRLGDLTSPGEYRALLALSLLLPQGVMLFQGQELGSHAPFLYFADHDAELNRLIREGRTSFLQQFESIQDPEVRQALADPAAIETFQRCKLRRTGKEYHSAAWLLHRDLLRLYRQTPAIRDAERGSYDGAVLNDQAFVLRFFGPADEDRLVLVNLGGDLELRITPEPLLAPPKDRAWQIEWHSEKPEYGGQGVPPLEMQTWPGWRVKGRMCYVLRAVSAS